jgi:trimethylamine:corrinoid methyltransferase-like protein
MNGAAERGLLCAATIEMARFYGLPAETCGAGTSQYTPGRRKLFNEACEEVDRILRTHQPLPLDEDMERERERIQKKAQEKEGF